MTTGSPAGGKKAAEIVSAFSAFRIDWLAT